ncbi:hypothetical protein BAE44_0002068 [Dichanthelium oligosanthes]|uniref:Uncharacterized protein n=1 Tax=Dichanthelium oligosanthes TaxID=888268 RepID=A0A1E5WHQ5_9POAL|nr:hypothetical protein BAE44_0002068 [Dichanthelium oligosanthes]
MVRVVAAYMYNKDFDPFVNASICITKKIKHYHFTLVKDDNVKFTLLCNVPRWASRSFCKQGAVLENTISTELRIREDLEADIEEDLEREIIDNMCHLARHLQKLYQHRDRRQRTGSVTDYQFSPPHAENVVLSEMAIRIKLDAQCQIDITKIEKDDATTQPNSCHSADQSDKKSLKIRHSDNSLQEAAQPSSPAMEINE